MMNAIARICIAEDHTILREGLKSLFETTDDFVVVSEATNGLEVIQCVQTSQPDMILMDLSMPKMNGLDVISTVKRRSPKTKVVVLTVHNVEEYLLSALEAGADGYLLKETTYPELLAAMRKIMNGSGVCLCPGVSQLVIQGYLHGRKTDNSSSLCAQLTKRERELLKLIAEGSKNREIAALLNISIKTVDKHRSNLMKKLGAHNAASVTSFAIANGLVTNVPQSLMSPKRSDNGA